MPQANSARWWACLAVVAAVIPLPVVADPVPGCPAVPHPIPPFEPLPADAPLFTRVQADRVEQTDEHVGLYGNVELRHEDIRILADQITFKRATEELQATGNVTLENLVGDRYQSPELYLQRDTFTGYTAQGSYNLGKNAARGEANRIVLDGKERAELLETTYTTCPPGKDDWLFKLGELELDKTSNTGTARNATLRFKKVPIFYWPWVRFPLSDERQTGFLFPTLGQSDLRGTELGIPFYWNIAPNYDATITPTWMSKRGLQVSNEFRYLQRPRSGYLRLEFLQDDDEFFGRDRWAVSYRHNEVVGEKWRANVDYDKVSDNAYLNDFGNNLAIASLTHLPRTGSTEYRGRRWNFRARVLAYQTVDPSISPASRPYDRLPQLQLLANPVPTRYGFIPVLETELDNFERDQSLTGWRINLLPGIDWPFRKSYGFIRPKLSVKYIGYSLDEPFLGDEQPDVTVPIFSLDSGLIFEREGQRFTQTLEPRVFYLNVPTENQDDLPEFDTSLPVLNFANLFRENRFVGGDRVGDTNQVTVALTTRTIGAEDGVERFRFSIGQQFFFEDREVNLTPGFVDTRDESDLVAELTGRFANRWYTRATIQWNRELRQTAQSGFFLQYQPAKDRIVNLGYRLRGDDNVEQVDLSTQWPIKRRWTVAASASYSLQDERNVQSYLGFGYRSCCWALRLFGQRRLNTTTTEQINEVLFQFEFTGLATAGPTPDSPLFQSIFYPSERFATEGPGYR
ncbi:MAG: LPS-assembly protein LptD [Acidiferrobacterales bacterium]